MPSETLRCGAPHRGGKPGSQSNYRCGGDQDDRGWDYGRSPAIESAFLAANPYSGLTPPPWDATTQRHPQTTTLRTQVACSIMSVMTEPVTIDELLSGLNPQQRAAATHGDGPLLVVAGAGTGKTATLVHRVAWLIARGVDPGRILLLTFTRRAAAEMLRRGDLLLRRLGHPGTTRVWGGTYHAIATRLLHRYGKAIGLHPGFTVHDRADSENLMNVVRTELDLGKADKRFPKKGTCMAIYSRCVNARERLDRVLDEHFTWCRDWQDELKRLFDGYVDRKEAAGVLDYDNLLLFWHALLGDCPDVRPGENGTVPFEAPKSGGWHWLRQWCAIRASSPVRRIANPSYPVAHDPGDAIRGLFDCVLVNEYQDTNTLQADILYALSPQGRGLTAVGDDAQSIYSFRGHGPQHPRFSQALRRRHDRHPGAELPQQPADPGGHQPGDLPGPGALHQNLWSEQRRGAAEAGQLRGRDRPVAVRHPPDLAAPRGGHRPAAPGGAVPRVASQHRVETELARPRSRFTSTAG